MTFFTELIFENARCSIDAADCALIIGVTYFLSSILGLVLKKHIGRRPLLLGNQPIIEVTLQGDPSGRQLHFVDIDLVVLVLMSALFSLATANLAELARHVGNLADL